MKKFARILLVALLTVTFAVSGILTACGGGKNPGGIVEPPVGGGGSNEKEAVVFSTGELDDVFNSFFSTSAYDGEITGQTQIGMMSANSKGEPYCGDDEPTVALNYRQVITYEGEDFENGSAPNLNGRDPNLIPVDDYYTTYQFLIKNHIKFSDGEDLTIKDVVFNLYTYLDPVYTGSSTIYSTAIKGLKEYRNQDPEVSESQDSTFLKTVTANAYDRIEHILFAYNKSSDTDRNDYRNRYYSTFAEREGLLKDVEAIRYMVWDEVNSDYRAAITDLDTYIEENEKIEKETNPAEKAKKDAIALRFTEVWEVFMYNAGYISVTKNQDGTIKTYESEAAANSATDKNGNPRKVGDKMIDYQNCWAWWHDRDSMIKIVFNLMMGIDDEGIINADADHSKTDSEGNKAPAGAEYGPKCDIIKDATGNATGSTLKKSETDEDYWNLIWNSDRILNNMGTVLTYWGTSGTALDKFTAEEKGKWFEEKLANNGGALAVDEISGIKVRKLNAGDEFKGEMGKTTLKEDMYVLEVVIDRVDPQAIWNFSFTVTPMHYYSNAANDTTNSGFTAEQDYRSFNYRVYDKDDNLLDRDGDVWNPDKKISVGRPFSDIKYFDRILKSSKIINVPVGAGMYKISKKELTDENYSPDKRPTFSEFKSNNIVYFIRNPYFYTTSGLGYESNDEAIKNNANITNCKIKFVRYQVVNNSKVLNALLSGEIHYGDPSATTDNINQIQQKANIKTVELDNNGYGYIGINAKFVPDVNIRRAIMHAIDVEMITGYYGTFAKSIYRPVSTVSWASPQNQQNPGINEETGNYIWEDFRDTQKGQKYEYDKKGEKYIKNLVTSAGYDTANFTKVGTKTYNGVQYKLEYTFTIAGASDDHPAFSAMQNAAEILNNCGFKITVRTDTNALIKLAAGALTVWAAAWGQGVDPDMYQVYHKDSQATSVRNWGYPEILRDNSGLYSYEKGIIDQLAEQIELGRSTLDRAERAVYYAKAYDLVMDLAVELPTYQRKNLFAYDSTVFDSSTFNTNLSAFSGPLSKFWKVSRAD